MNKVLITIIVSLLLATTGYSQSDRPVPIVVKEIGDPAALIAGKWKVGSEPDGAEIEFAKDGTGKITETTPQGASQVGLKWQIFEIYGTACIVVVTYEKPNEVERVTWLVAFAGHDSFITQPTKSSVAYWERLK